jgi:hypothetical protein
MPPYRLLAIDIDGTLVAHQALPTPATCRALERAAEAGVHIVLATGRRYSRTLHLVEPLGLATPLVTASGALIKDPVDHRTIFCAEFTPEQLRHIVRITVECGHDPVLCADTFAEDFDFYQFRRDPASPELAEYFSMNPHDGRLLPDMLQSPPPGVFEVFTMGTREQMIALEATLHKQMPGELYSHVLHVPRYTGFICEVAPAGVTKWTGIRRLASEWGIADGEICAVGDDVNDIPMIRAAGLGVAMGNAQPTVKAAADRVAPTQEDDGLVAVVGWVLGEGG